MPVPSLGWENPMEESMATHSSILAWSTPWTEEPDGLQAAAAAAKSLQSCPTLCDPIDSSPPGSPVPVILQARTLEWVAISFSKAIEIYSLVVLVARSLESRFWQGGFLLEVLMENMFHVFPCILVK